jgi:hypothetical protein
MSSLISAFVSLLIISLLVDIKDSAIRKKKKSMVLSKQIDKNKNDKDKDKDEEEKSDTYGVEP